MNSKDTNSSGEIRKEVLRDLKKIDHDLDKIQSRLTPGQIIDEMIFSHKRSTLGETLGYLKDNPIGSSFLAVGTILLMESEDHRSVEVASKEKLNEAYGLTRSKARGVMEEAKHKATLVKDNLQQRVDQLRHKTENKVDKITEMKDSASQSIPEMKQEFSELQASIRQSGPWTYLALGVGLGMVSGASAPLTEKELSLDTVEVNERLSAFFSELREAFKHSASILKDEFVDELKGVHLFRS